MTELGVDPSAKDALVSDRRANRRRNIRTVLITLGIIFVPLGVGLFGWSYMASCIGNGSMIIMLSQDRITPETLSKLHYTSWREPSASIRPFRQPPKSFKDCEIIRYRRGLKVGWLFLHTHYEAQYQMPDGSLVIGPAFGPWPYIAPNIFTLGLLIIVGVTMIVIGIALRPVKVTKTEIS